MYKETALKCYNWTVVDKFGVAKKHSHTSSGQIRKVNKFETVNFVQTELYLKQDRNMPLEL